MAKHLSFLFCLSLVYTCIVSHVTFAAPPVVEVNIGVILDLNSVAGKMSLTSINLALSDLVSENMTESTNPVLHVRDTKGDIATATAAALDLLNSVKVHLIIGPQNSYEAPYTAAVETTARVPVLSFSASKTHFPHPDLSVQNIQILKS